MNLINFIADHDITILTFDESGLYSVAGTNVPTPKRTTNDVSAEREALDRDSGYYNPSCELDRATALNNLPEDIRALSANALTCLAAMIQAHVEQSCAGDFDCAFGILEEAAEWAAEAGINGRRWSAFNRVLQPFMVPNFTDTLEEAHRCPLSGELRASVTQFMLLDHVWAHRNNILAATGFWAISEEEADWISACQGDYATLA